MNTKNLVFQEVHIQRGYELETIQDILTSVATLTHRGPVAWEVRCKSGQMRYLLGTPSWSLERVQTAFKAQSNAQFGSTALRTPVTHCRKLRISKAALSLSCERAAAMTRAAFAAMANTRTDVETVVQIVLGAAHAPRTIPKNTPDPTTSWIQAVLGNVHVASAEQRRSLREKAEQYAFETVIRVGCSGNTTESPLHEIISALRTLESAGVRISAEKELPDHLNLVSIPWRMPLVLNVKELSCYMLLPAGEEDLTGVPGLHPKLLLPPKWYKGPAGRDDRTFAESLDHEPKKLSIPKADSLRHLSILGGTGVGKSTVLLNLILKDIEAGRSCLVCDPKSELVNDLLARIPDERCRDVIVIDPTSSSPVGFNPLALHTDPSLTADAILAVFKELFSENWGIRTSDVLGAALNTLARVPNSTLLWLVPLLTDESFRKRIVRQINDPIGLNDFWRHFEEMKGSERRTEIAPVMNKLRSISVRPGLRNVLGQAAPKFNLNELYTKRKIVLVPLSKGLIGTESARLLGSLIISLTWLLAMTRANIPAEKRHPVAIYIDEFQSYLNINDSFDDMLAQARSLGVGYTLAHQYLGQLPPQIKSGIMANCKSKICFNLDATDAKEMSAQAPELMPLDFMSLSRFHIYSNFQSGGKATGWISGKTFPPPEPLRLPVELHAECMTNYGVPGEETEAALIEMMMHSPPESNAETTDVPIGRRKKE